MYLVLRIIKTIMLYLSSDWFAELGFTFFNYHYTAKLIKSSYNLKCLLLKLTYRYLDNQPLNDADVRKLQDIIKIIAKEASMDKKIAQNQYRYAYYGDLRDELEYIYQNVNQRLTLKVSLINYLSQSQICHHNSTYLWAWVLKIY